MLGEPVEYGALFLLDESQKDTDFAFSTFRLPVGIMAGLVAGWPGLLQAGAVWAVLECINIYTMLRKLKPTGLEIEQDEQNDDEIKVGSFWWLYPWQAAGCYVVITIIALITHWIKSKVWQ